MTEPELDRGQRERLIRLRAVYEWVKVDLYGRPFYEDVLLALLYQAHVIEENDAVDIPRQALSGSDGSEARWFVMGIAGRL